MSILPKNSDFAFREAAIFTILISKLKISKGHFFLKITRFKHEKKHFSEF
jgi:hypothetical protein